MSTYSFNEFWKVFDNNVWVWIFITLILLLAGIVRISGGAVLSSRIWSGSKLLCLIKVLLEQGDPFPAILTKSLKFRFVIGSTLLAGLVLSNAYKSTNVYNIVKPRYIVPYQEVGEVMTEKFSIHVRVSNLDYYIDSMAYGRSYNFKPPLNGTYAKWIRLQTGTGLLDEIMAFLETFKSKVQFSYPENGIRDLEYNQTMQMIHAGKFHPIIQKNILETFKGLAPLKQIGYWGIQIAYNRKQRDRWSKAFNRYVFDKQHKFILKNLQECAERVAWVLPYYVAKHYSRILSSNSSYSHVGRKSFFPINFNFFMRGLISIHVVKRFLMAPTSGIIDWLQKSILWNHEGDTLTNLLPSKPSMKGNILIVFVIWSTGMIVSVCFYIFEMRKIIWRFCVKSVYYMLSVYHLGKQQICLFVPQFNNLLRPPPYNH